MLSKLKVDQADCHFVEFEWTTDEAAASVVVFEDNSFVTGDVYVWRTNGSAPYKVGFTVYGARWSSDSGKLLLTHLVPDADGLPRGVGVTIVDINGKQFSDFPIAARDTGDVNWFTDDVLVSSARAGFDCPSWYYYDSLTGKPLGSWARCFASDDLVSQKPALSSNKRWQVLDELGYYTLYDLRNKTGHSLAERRENYLKFVGWTGDDSTFYFVSRPVTSTSVSGPNTPFGLLALNPFTFQFNLLFKDAMEVIWSPDRRLAFVAFPVRQADGALGLEGGILNFMAGTMIGRQFVSDRMLYANPAFGDLIPAAWSHGGTQVVFGDSHGNLTLLTGDGTARSLAIGLPQDSWPQQVHYLWSPDDRYLLVQYDTQAWIAEP